jgi:CPA2 family monovalent cation:H+ antiporter-2
LEHPEVLVELGAVLVGLAILSRAAERIGIPTIPLFLSAGLAFGRGGIVPLVTAEEFVEIGAEIGLVLLLFMLGLEYTPEELISTLRTQAPIGVLDLVLNFTPGFLAGLVLGWASGPAIALGGVTYVSSSGIVAKLLADLGWIGNRETPMVLSILVVEDLAMALYLPVVGALLAGGGGLGGVVPALVAVVTVVVVLAAAVRTHVPFSRLIFSDSDEALLLSILGITLLVAGMAESFRISAAVAALLVGILVSGPPAEGAQTLLAPLRDLFAAMFFAFVGLSIDPSDIPPVLPVAAALACAGTLTKFATGWLGARRAAIGPRGRARAGTALVARGEFSIAVAGLATAAGVDPDFEALAISFVFLLAIVGPVLARVADGVTDFVLDRPARR